MSSSDSPLNYLANSSRLILWHDGQCLNSQSWPFPNQLMLGFHAGYTGGEIIPALGEIARAQWFYIHSLPTHPPAQSIAGWLINQYRLTFDLL